MSLGLLQTHFHQGLTSNMVFQLPSLPGKPTKPSGYKTEVSSLSHSCPPAGLGHATSVTP